MPPFVRNLKSVFVLTRFSGEYSPSPSGSSPSYALKHVPQQLLNANIPYIHELNISKHKNNMHTITLSSPEYEKPSPNHVAVVCLIQRVYTDSSYDVEVAASKYYCLTCHQTYTSHECSLAEDNTFPYRSLEEYLDNVHHISVAINNHWMHCSSIQLYSSESM